MDEQMLEFIDDKLYLSIPMPEYGEGIYRTTLVMTKEVFQECYKRWIDEPKVESEG